MNTAVAETTLPLTLDVAAIKAEIVPAPDDTARSETEAKAQQIATALVSNDPDNAEQRGEATRLIEDMGKDLQAQGARSAGMLTQQIKTLAARGEDGGTVAKTLVHLREQVEDLSPAGVEFSPTGLRKLLGSLPFVGTPVKRYFERFQSAQDIIEDIDKALVDGRDQLSRDNVTLATDRETLASVDTALTRQIALARALDTALTAEGERADEKRKAFIGTELVFPLRQRVMDLQQQQAVAQQGILAIEVVRRNNLELIRGVERARSVTISALNTAVTVALALANQKLVLERVTALNTTTSDLIGSTAKQLKTQGAAIHEQAASATLDIETLKTAFEDVNEAIDAIGAYRAAALPEMERTITDLDGLLYRSREAIDNAEAGRALRGLPQPVEG